MMVHLTYQVNIKRYRKIFDVDFKPKMITLNFKIEKIIGNEIDADGCIRYGAMLWFCCENACNHYQAYWRYVDKLDAVYIGTQIKLNPGKTRNIEDGCAGHGYHPLGDPRDINTWRVKSDIKILDGNEHELGSVLNDVYAEQINVLSVKDDKKLFNSFNIGVRSDNVQINYDLDVAK